MTDHDKLDQLLNSVSPPEAPAWFATRVISRLKTENTRHKGFTLLFTSWKWATAGAIVFILTATIAIHSYEDYQQKKSIFNALDAFQGYHQDVEDLWNLDELD
jgi:hypothetical protein